MPGWARQESSCNSKDPASWQVVPVVGSQYAKTPLVATVLPGRCDFERNAASAGQVFRKRTPFPSGLSLGVPLTIPVWEHLGFGCVGALQRSGGLWNGPFFRARAWLGLLKPRVLTRIRFFSGGVHSRGANWLSPYLRLYFRLSCPLRRRPRTTSGSPGRSSRHRLAPFTSSFLAGL